MQTESRTSNDCYLLQLPVPLPVPPGARKAGLGTPCAPSVQGGGCSEALAAIGMCRASEIELEKDLPRIFQLSCTKARTA